MAIGFPPSSIARLVVMEAVAVGVLGGGVGILIAYPFMTAVGQFLEENMGQFFPYFRVPPEMAGVAVALAVLLAVVASALPAYRAWKLNIVQALRRVG